MILFGSRSMNSKEMNKRGYDEKKHIINTQYIK